MIFFYFKKYFCDVKIKINFIFLKSCVTELFINIFKATRKLKQTECVSKNQIPDLHSNSISLKWKKKYIHPLKNLFSGLYVVSIK
jgi:hypothetical protein